MDNVSEKRESFKSSFGILAAAIGSAVGLGNIWRFPYITGMDGGAAFIIIYLICVAIVGIPVLLSEFIIGRTAKKGAVGSFKKLAPRSGWFVGGALGVLAAFVILIFYGVIAGWTLGYVIKSVTNQFAGKNVNQIKDIFVSFTSSPIRPIICQVIFTFLTGLVVATGVENGIEKYSKILVPVLVAILVILDIRAVTLPGAKAGISFLFKPDFSKIQKGAILDALGHCFFSLSLGAGTMITYGSYMGEKERLGKTALNVAVSDTIIALLAGIAIFPAVFAFGIEPNSGPGLVFITLPNVFSKMPGGYVFSIMFFLLLAIAALTSTISLLEAVVAYGKEELNMSRKKATIIATVLVAIFGSLASLSQGPLSGWTIAGKNLLDFLDYISANYLMTIAAFIVSIFVGWKMGKKSVSYQLTNNGSIKAGYTNAFVFIAKFISPLAIIIIFLQGIGII